VCGATVFDADCDWPLFLFTFPLKLVLSSVINELEKILWYKVALLSVSDGGGVHVRAVNLVNPSLNFRI